MTSGNRSREASGDRSQAAIANDHDALPRWQELACDAALFGLDEAERAELDALDADADVLLDLELAAGEVAARAHESLRADARADDALPASLGEKLFALAAAHAAAKVEPDAAADERTERRSPPRDERRSPPRAAREGSRARVRLQALRDRRRQAEGRTSPLPWLLAAAAIVLALFGWLRRDTAPLSVPPPPPSASSLPPETPASAREALLAVPGTATAAWKATTDPSAASATGDVIWHNGVQRGYMRFRGLAPNNPAETQYQLWIFDGDRDERYPVDGGVFNVGPDGEVVVPIEAKLHVNKPTLFAITVEKPGGVVVSSRERIVLTASLPPT